MFWDRRWKYVAPFLLVAASVVVTAAHAETVPAQYRGDGGALRLPANQNSTQVWHLAALRKYELDKKYGFDLQIVPAATSQMTATLLQSGGADIGIFGWIDIIRLRNAGVKLIGVAPFLQWGADHIVVPANSTAKNIGDLKGKKIGVFSRTNMDFILDLAMAKTVYKMDPAKDLIIQDGAVGLLRGLIETGQLDAAHMFNNLTPAMVAEGKARILYQMKEIIDTFNLPPTPELLYGASEDYLAAHPQNIRAFLAAYREAVGILRKEDAVWLEHGKTLEMTPESIKLLRDEMRVDLWTEFKPTTEADIHKAFDFLVAQAGSDAFGFATIPSGFMTRDYE